MRIARRSSFFSLLVHIICSVKLSFVHIDKNDVRLYKGADAAN